MLVKSNFQVEHFNDAIYARGFHVAKPTRNQQKRKIYHKIVAADTIKESGSGQGYFG